MDETFPVLFLIPVLFRGAKRVADGGNRTLCVDIATLPALRVGRDLMYAENPTERRAIDGMAVAEGW